MNTIGGVGFFPFGVPGSLRGDVAEARPASGQAPGTRQAAAPGAAIRLDLGGAGTDAETRLRERLGQVVGVLHRDAAERDAVVGRMMDALRGRLDGADAVEIRVTSLRVDHGGAATVTQPVIEVGTVKDGRVGAEDTSVFALDGRSAGLGAAAIAEGWRHGTFASRQDLPPAPDADAGLKAAREALERLRALRK
ncbi:hypothetical protein [Arenibaculum sp.]|jgi:hypothetical protein|uniref:hypothetical protein n=1 Tax=Arenibaculum sp. TaxID=2865862 RepID=UPI002E0D4960|nr:hypothetical protein [Arenibaculum sp.]